MTENIREFRFRAWDKTHTEMIYFDELRACDCTPDGFDELVHLESMSKTRTRSYDAEYEVMQYTGLKDKNGKEIYEGDIVNWSLDYLEIIFKDGGFGYYTAFGKARPSYIPLSGHNFLNLFKKESEIIGNIYENKDLLK